MRPLIAVCPLSNEKRQLQLMQPGYLRAIELAGGLPVVLPMTGEKEVLEAILDRCDGLLMTGGHDVQPYLYGQELLPECGELSPGRDELELWALDYALERDMPILAICRGVQLLNVRLGGTLWQDLPSQRPESLGHSQEPPYEEAVHSVEILEKSLLAELIGPGEFRVNSLHHQAVRNVAPGLTVEAVSTDGIVEGVSLPGKKFVLGVQWHPEYRCEVEPRELALFERLIWACQK